MFIPGVYQPPTTLLEGQTYLLKINIERGENPIYQPVKFAAYTACPAMVVVQAEAQGKFRCLRARLFQIID